MPSLTPPHRSEEATHTAFRDGIVSGALTLVPSGACVYLAMRNPRFVKATNWQSRTALVIMPALFSFALTSESKLQHRMEEMAAEADHSRATAQWAEGQRERQRKQLEGSMAKAAVEGGAGGPSASSLSSQPAAAASKVVDAMSKEEAERQLTELYRRGVEDSGVRIVPGDRLGVHHQFSNFLMENPFKVLAAAGVPTVLYIFKGRSEKSHLQLQMKIMHTRVFGQFAVITLLLSLMGFKEYMDRNGKFITEAEAERKVEEMHAMREQLMERLEKDRAKMAERDRVLQRAQEKNMRKLSHSGKKEDLARYGVLEGDLRDDDAEDLVADMEEEQPAKKSRKKKEEEEDKIAVEDEITAPLGDEASKSTMPVSH